MPKKRPTVYADAEREQHEYSSTAGWTPTILKRLPRKAGGDAEDAADDREQHGLGEELAEDEQYVVM